jgi:hypothetical protein
MGPTLGPEIRKSAVSDLKIFGVNRCYCVAQRKTRSALLLRKCCQHRYHLSFALGPSVTPTLIVIVQCNHNPDPSPYAHRT